ncbi:hypothetical protein RHSIM_Rhsim07G0112800 [Rhododendron simsii]|uniref:Uncharacterized protein n=1 Tax=Rhododendron simsii TaxID=118357 RepID=A0A834GPK5_RHOSS|nr:hypothetical protein RHSIM_Rhsim07G0112800 [Rhododendron simsii]
MPIRLMGSGSLFSPITKNDRGLSEKTPVSYTGSRPPLLVEAGDTGTRGTAILPRIQLRNSSIAEHNISRLKNRAHRECKTNETEFRKRTEAKDTERIEPNSPIPVRPNWANRGSSSAAYAKQYKSELETATHIVFGCVWNGEAVPFTRYLRSRKLKRDEIRKTKAALPALGLESLDMMLKSATLMPPLKALPVLGLESLDMMLKKL